MPDTIPIVLSGADDAPPCAVIPVALLESAHLSPLDKLVYALLVVWFGEGITGEGERMLFERGVGLRWEDVCESLDRLAATGWLTVDGGFVTTNTSPVR